MKPLKYFVFNKKRDYQSGYSEHIRITEQGIELQVKNTQVSGVFISRLMDSRKEGNQWHRAVVQSEGYGDDSIRFSFYCSDYGQIAVDGNIWEWADLIQSREISLEEKRRVMKPYLVHRVADPQDILLYHAKGRYLWMEIQLFCQAEFIPRILNMKIYAENRSFLQYLPQIYQTEGQDSFLARYLSLFEAVYQDMDTEIRNSARHLDPQSAEPEFLRWVAGWVGISQVHLWKEEKLRILLKGIVKKNLLRGTREYIKYMVEVFTGEAPYLVEYSEIEQYRDNPSVYRNLKTYYAHGPYEVNILVRERAVPGVREQTALEKMIEDIKPAHMNIHLIILKPYIYLNQNVYAGINSVLGTWQKAYLNGVTGIPSVIGAVNSEGEEKRYEESEKFSL